MALQFRDNRYIGVNAHLNSYLQQPVGMWSSFHHELITSLQKQLDRILPPNYYAVAEQGLQLSKVGSEKEHRKSVYPDVSIFQSQPSIKPSTSSVAIAPIATILFSEVEELFDEDDLLIRVAVYRSEPDDVRGKLITAIEILSKSNKPHSSHFTSYWEKRWNLLQTGVNLVEIDLLHETPPIIHRLPSYPDQHEKAYPYNIIVSKPYPNFESGYSLWYGTKIGGILPQLPIPLLDEEEVILDLQASYNDAFSGVRIFWQLVDYEQVPANFERYTESDQQAIREMLEKIRNSESE